MKANSKNHFCYNKNLRRYANDLRKRMTKAEICLWNLVLKESQMRGFVFRRQRPVSKFIADFMSKDLKLIIEVDGISHDYDEVFIRDMYRQKLLESYGFIVVRFQDEEILTNIDGVRSELEKVVDEIMKAKHIKPRVRKKNVRRKRNTVK